VTKNPKLKYASKMTGIGMRFFGFFLMTFVDVSRRNSGILLA